MAYGILLQANRLGITTVVSTDSIRHMLRSFSSPEENPVLFASTYQAGQALTQSTASSSTLASGASASGSAGSSSSNGSAGSSILQLSGAERAVKGYKAQCEQVMAELARLIGSHEARHESMVCEGVHFSIGFVVSLMRRHAGIVPFLVYIKNERKHVERMAVRAKYMTLDPKKNKYVENMHNIRAIQVSASSACHNSSSMLGHA